MKKQRSSLMMVVPLIALTITFCVFAFPQSATGAPVTDGATLAFAKPSRVAPELRSLELPDAFPADLTTDLPALAASDVVRDDGSGLSMNGRVYDVDLHSDVGGRWTRLPDGSELWTAAIKSPNAWGLRLRIEPFQPPGGAELIIYNAQNPEEAYGPYGAERSREGLPFWSHIVSGNELRVEYYLPKGVSEQRIDPNLQITGAVQMFPHPIEQRLDCRIDVTCYPEWDGEAFAVANFDFIGDDGVGHGCTGTIVNRLPSADYARVFLTAAHCINSESEANSVLAVWFHQTDECDGVAPDFGTLPSTLGATLLATAIGSDNSLLGFTDELPTGVTWAGWDADPVPPLLPGTLIHHPSGTRKSISFGRFGPIETRCVEPVVMTYLFGLSDGGQEPGSSGAPVFDDLDHRIRAVASCSEDSGCIPDEDTWEGSFSHAYYELEPFLDANSDVWVDISYTGTERGTQTQPWDRTLEGYYGVHGGGTVHMESGDYPPVILGGGYRTVTFAGENGEVTLGVD